MYCVKQPHKCLAIAFVLGVAVLPVLWLLLPRAALATDQLMRTLPAYQKYQCLICHTVALPKPNNAPLSQFGVNFKDNGNVWDATLAEMNSDGDRCSNGFELGDVDGDGIFDNGTPVVEHSNPSNASDCTIALTEQTWGVIKQIFSKELPQLQEPESLSDEFRRHFP
jgi:hypothetical protein